jgi:hypothetical protein
MTNHCACRKAESPPCRIGIWKFQPEALQKGCTCLGRRIHHLNAQLMATPTPFRDLSVEMRPFLAAFASAGGDHPTTYFHHVVLGTKNCQFPNPKQ